MFGGIYTQQAKQLYVIKLVLSNLMYLFTSIDVCGWILPCVGSYCHMSFTFINISLAHRQIFFFFKVSVDYPAMGV